MTEKMSLKEFKKEVFKLLKDEYAPHCEEDHLNEALEEYSDIIYDGYNHDFGIEYGAEYAARNISMCI